MSGAPFNVRRPLPGRTPPLRPLTPTHSFPAMAFIYAFSLFTFFVFTTYFFLFLFLICCAIVLRFAFLARAPPPVTTLPPTNPSPRPSARHHVTPFARPAPPHARTPQALRVNQSILAVQALRARARSIELDVTPIPGQRRLFERLRYSILAYFLVEMAVRAGVSALNSTTASLTVRPRVPCHSSVSGPYPWSSARPGSVSSAKWGPPCSSWLL